MLTYARKKIDEGYDVVIMGHRHSPSVPRSEKASTSISATGSKHNTYAEMSGGRIELKQWRQKRPA